MLVPINFRKKRRNIKEWNTVSQKPDNSCPVDNNKEFTVVDKIIYGPPSSWCRSFLNFEISVKCIGVR